jgi:F0F1-type ATP synthase assembly protein I
LKYHQHAIVARSVDAGMSEDPRRDWGEAWTLAFTLVGLVVVFAGLGWAADHWLGTMPWLMVAWVFVGAGLSLVYAVSILFSRSGRPDGKDTGADGRKRRGRSC